MSTRAPRAPFLCLRLSTVVPVHYFHILRLTVSTIDAGLACSRAKHHYDPQQFVDLHTSETVTNTTDAAATTLEIFRLAFRQTHERMRKVMYFC